MGRPPGVTDGGSTASKDGAAGESHGSHRDCRVAEVKSHRNGFPWRHKKGDPGFQFEGNGVDVVRSTIINKILSFQYRLGKLIGRKKAGHICINIERIFTNLFGREVYCDRK